MNTFVELGMYNVLQFYFVIVYRQVAQVSLFWQLCEYYYYLFRGVKFQKR